MHRGTAPDKRVRRRLHDASPDNALFGTDPRAAGTVRSPVTAGIDGFTWGGYAKIEWLWVHEDHRRAGLGRRLMEQAELESARRGCMVIRVDTHTFQAPDFYARLGYTLIGRSQDTPVGHGELFLHKRVQRHSS